MCDFSWRLLGGQVICFFVFFFCADAVWLFSFFPSDPFPHLPPLFVLAPCLVPPHPTDTVEYGETKRTLPCTHSYHSTCVRAWLKRVNRCPQCNNATVKERQRGIRRARRDARDAAAMAAAALASSGVIGPTSAGAVTAGAEGGGSVGVGGGVGGDGVGDGGGAAATGSSSGPAPEFVVVPLGEEAAEASAAPSADGGRLSAVGGEAGSAGEGGPATAVPCPQAPVEV